MKLKYKIVLFYLNKNNNTNTFHIFLLCFCCGPFNISLRPLMPSAGIVNFTKNQIISKEKKKRINIVYYTLLDFYYGLIFEAVPVCPFILRLYSARLERKGFLTIITDLWTWDFFARIFLIKDSLEGRKNELINKLIHCFNN